MFNNFFINIAKNTLNKPITTKISHEHKKIDSSDILDIINYSFKGRYNR